MMADADNNNGTGERSEGAQQSGRRSWTLGSMPGINRLTNSGASLQDMVHRLIPPELQRDYIVSGEIRAPGAAVNLVQSLNRDQRRNLAGRNHGHSHHGHQHQHLVSGHTHSHLASSAMMPLGVVEPSPNIAGVAPLNSADSVVLDMLGNASNGNTLVSANNNEPAAIPLGINARTAELNLGLAGNAGPTHAGHGPAPPADQDVPNPIQMRRYISLSGCVPFVLLLLTKLLFDHRLGIFIFIAMFGTFLYANNVLVRYVAQRDNGKQLLAVLVLLSSSTSLFYYCFYEQELYRSLYFTLPNIEHMDVWTLFWIVGVSDFVIRFAVIILKSCIALLSKSILKHKRKGKYLSLLEYISQLYTSIIPVMPWVCYLMSDDNGAGWFSMILVAIYTICKGQQLFLRVMMLRKAIINFMNDQRFGTVPSTEDIDAAENCCAICQDSFTDPVKLSCKHVFCEDCISVWFVKERTCPMCRAEVVNTDGMLWRDGATTAYVQLY